MKFWKLLPALLLSVPLFGQVPASAFGSVTFNLPAAYIVSAMGGKCLDVEGGRMVQGARVIAFPCDVENGQLNQRFNFSSTGQIKAFGSGSNMCVDDKGGLLKPMDNLVLWPCNNQQNQRWRLVNGQMISINGLCVDLQGGPSPPPGNQPAILFNCNPNDTQRNQHFVVGAPAMGGPGTTGIPVGAMGAVNPKMSRLQISMGGGFVVYGTSNVVTGIAPPANTIYQRPTGPPLPLIDTTGSNLIAVGPGNIISSRSRYVIIPLANSVSP